MALYRYVVEAVIFCLAYIKASVYRFIKFYRCVTIPDYIPNRPESVKVLEYNLTAPPTAPIPLAMGPSITRLRSILGKISQYDVVVLHNAYQAGSSAISAFIASARSVFPYIASGPVPHGLMNLKDAGLLVLSKFPIIAHDVITFSKGSKPTMGAIYAKIRFSPFENMHFLVTELDERSAETRKAQLGEILALVQRHVTDRLPIFLVGALNLGADYQSVVGSLNIQHTDTIDLASDIKAKQPPYPVGTQGFFYFKPQPEDYVLASASASLETFDVDANSPKSASKAGIVATLKLVKLTP
jgi:hypothetical protein